MDFLFNSRFDTLIDGISGQFGTTPLGILLFFITIAAFPLGLLFIYRSQQKKTRSEKLQKSRQIIAKKADSLELSSEEQALLYQLAEETGSRESGYLVLFDELRFTKALELLAKGGFEADEITAASLRVKLDFKSDNSTKPRSTTALPKGSNLLLKRESEKSILHCEIAEILPSGFEIRIKEPFRLTPGDRALFQYQNSQGVFLFKSECIKRDGQLHLMSHQEKFRQKQQRGYYRSPYSGPANIALFEKGDALRSNFIEIGGGGASLENPGGKFRQGDFLSLTFFLPGNAHPFDLRGQVVRTSRHESQLHLKFEGIKDSDRDKIIRQLFKPAVESK